LDYVITNKIDHTEFL